VIYEIWDRRSGNRLGEFATPQDALRMVSKMAAGASHDAIQGLVFDREYDGRTTKILEGQALVESALRQEAGETSASRGVRRKPRRAFAKKAAKRK